ncbi:kell blood group glycoprotein isoform X4 [Dromiciops gliroides]|uniref:kell blood group glycoprotein isoform X4 n=1 Tax=Dromiciops gliroides TaxID=33562 RepID=UPI001CC7AFA5|nr:kell blood group glycoprotein isoform X4 [Dromiciops gliroides]
MATVWTQQGSREEGSSRRNLLGWGLMIILLLSLILVFSVLLFYTFHTCGPRPCESPVCLELVASYLTTGNASALPCTDFFSFVCGNLMSGWTKESRNILQVLKEKNQNRLRKILEASAPWPPDSEEEKTVRFYKACMDTDAIDASGAEPLIQVIEELGGWRISGNWTLPDFNHTLKLLMSQYGSFPFFKAYLRPQPSPPHLPVIQIDQPEFQMPFRPDQKNYPEILRAYLSYLQQLGTLLGGDEKVVLEHASVSISTTSKLLLAAKPLDQRKQEGKLFQETTIAQLQATQLFSEIQNALSRHLKKLRWIDEGSRREAQTKLSKMKVEMGAPEEVLKPDPAKQDYQDINFGPSFLQTFLSCSRSLRERTMRGFLGPPYSHSWKVSPWEVNAYYSMSDNVAVFPAGLLQPPFFHPGYPSAVNFGAAGSVMAHELMHIFDQYLVPGGCPACDMPGLHGELLCLQQHYESFSLPAGSTFNSSHALLENAADMGAVVIAMQAYRKWQQKHKGETILPSLGLSPYQLFYQSYGQVMCGTPNLQDAQDLHSPPILRVHGPLSNTPTFARYFNCPKGTPMNPGKHCQLW